MKISKLSFAVMTVGAVMVAVTVPAVQASAVTGTHSATRSGRPKPPPAPAPGAALLGTYTFTARPTGRAAVTGVLQLNQLPIEAFNGIAAGVLTINPASYQAFQGASDAVIAYDVAHYLDANGRFDVQTKVVKHNDGSLELVFGSPQPGSLSGGSGIAGGDFTRQSDGTYSGAYSTADGVTGTITESFTSR